MKLERVEALASKDVKTLLRNPAWLFLIVLFPVVMMGAFGLAFGSGSGQSTTYQVAVVNLNAGGQYPRWSSDLLGNLSSVGVLNLRTYTDNSTAQAQLSQGKVQAVLVIPSDFGQSVESYRTNSNSTGWVYSTVSLYVDRGSVFASSALPPLFQQELAATVLGRADQPVQLPVRLATPQAVQAASASTLDTLAPGIFSFASIFLIMTVAQTSTTEREEGLLRRIQTTPASASELMTSQVISNMVFAVVQAVILFAVAFLIGYRSDADFLGVALAFAILVVFSLCNVGFGLITATIAKNSQVATGLSFLFIMPQMFLGTFVTVGLSSAAQAVGRFVPAYYVTDALTSIFSRGAPLSSPSIILDFGVVSAVSVAILVLGIAVMEKTGRS